MSRREALPPLARDLLSVLATSLRTAAARAKDLADKSQPGDGLVSRFSRASIEAGFLGGTCSHAADDIDRVLALYPPLAPKKGRAG